MLWIVFQSKKFRAVNLHGDEVRVKNGDRPLRHNGAIDGPHGTPDNDVCVERRRYSRLHAGCHADQV